MAWKPHEPRARRVGRSLFKYRDDLVLRYEKPEHALLDDDNARGASRPADLSAGRNWPWKVGSILTTGLEIRFGRARRRPDHHCRNAEDSRFATRWLYLITLRCSSRAFSAIAPSRQLSPSKSGQSSYSEVTVI